MNWFNKLVANILPYIPKNIVFVFSKKYMAGAELSDAVTITRDLMKKGCCATIDVMGEEVKVKEDSLNAVALYKEVLASIKNENLDANISVKPTHMGLAIDKEFCYNNIRELVLLAKENNNFVRIDMEDHPTTTDTLEIADRLKKEFPDNVGVVIQAYLRRTIDDIQGLMKTKMNLRLCKGIYKEPRKEAYHDMQIINSNFNLLLDRLLGNGNYVGIATHDEKLIWHALNTVKDLKLKKDQYEFQMLLGVTEDLRNIIVSGGHRLRVYVPFGKHWFAYSTRRLKENPDIVKHVVKSLFRLN